MAADLEGFERAYRLRSTADDVLLRQVFGEAELEELRASKAGLLETARAYFPHLTSSTYDRLAREPSLLALEKDRCGREMEQLAVTNYAAFIGNAKVTQAVQREFRDIQQRLDDMGDNLLPVQETIQTFQAKAADLSLRRAALRGVLQQHSTLLELLELPQLLDACIRNQMYDESLELLAFTANLLQAHELRGEEIPVMVTLREDIAMQRANLHSTLVGQLKTDIHLPACVRIIGFVRRLQEHSEEELSRLFIEHRGAFLDGHKMQVESLRSNRGSVVTALRNAADLLRTHVFDIGTQYKALFPQDDGPFAVWLNQQILWLTGLLRAHVAPSTASGKAAGGAAARQSSVEARLDASALATVLRQCWHASTTLKRLGGHFFPSVASIFEARMEQHIFELLDVSLLNFHAELGRYDWVPSTAFAGAGQEGAGEGESNWLHPEALELMRHRPLAVFANDLVQGFNELRQCAIYGLRVTVVTRCQETLLGAVNLLRAARAASQLAGSAKAKEFDKACQNFARVLAPFAAAHLDALFGAAARLDVEEVVATMTPDLLPPELPGTVDLSEWDMGDVEAAPTPAASAGAGPGDGLEALAVVEASVAVESSVGVEASTADDLAENDDEADEELLALTGGEASEEGPVEEVAPTGLEASEDGPVEEVAPSG